MAITSIKTGSSFTNLQKYNDAVAGNPPLMATPTATDGGTGSTVSVAFTTVTGATSYGVLSSPGSFTATGTSSPLTVSGLTSGTAYTFQVRGVNTNSTGPYSAASNSVTPVSPSSYESITSVNPSGLTEVTFSSIPSTYTALQIRANVSATSGSTTLRMRFNGDTGNNYTDHYVSGNGGSVTASYDVPVNEIRMLSYTNSGYSQAYLGVSIIDIFDYAATSRYKTIKSINGLDLNGADVGYLVLSSGLWLNTSGITSITLKLNGQAFSSNTSISLYGIKG